MVLDEFMLVMMFLEVVLCEPGIVEVTLRLILHPSGALFASIATNVRIRLAP